ncbi:MAG: methyltransferase domain-containing protein [Geminicoccaceae bacterium]
MLDDRQACDDVLRCPKTGRQLRPQGPDRLVAEPEGDDAPTYPVVDGVPILVDFESSVLDRDKLIKSRAESVLHRPARTGARSIVKRLLAPPSAVTARNVERLIKELETRPEPARILVVGGGSVGQGMQPLYDHPRLRLTGFDIFATAYTQFVADAHKIPVADRSFDAVVIQAVLEHVLQPDQVVGEIWRVLKDDGLVYAETPFMQHVHEGAYDFTRFTESGHRNLFRRFGLIASGQTANAGTQLVWAIEYFSRGLFRSVAVGKAAKLAFFWLQYFDRMIPEAHAIDSASGGFFLGRKAETELSPKEIIAHYRGARH